MPITFDTSIYFTGNANPLTRTYTCGANSKLLVLDIGTEIAAAAGGRVAGRPNFSGALMTNVCVSAGIGGEAIIEMFALQNPSTSAQYTVSIPNAGGITINCHLSSYNCSVGYTATLDTSSSLTSASNKVNVSTNITTSTTNELFVTASGNGATNSMLTTFPGAFITGILDKGACQNEAAWGIIAAATNTRVGFTTNSTPGISGLVTGVWKETKSPGNISKVSGLAYASISKIIGLATASIFEITGVAT